MGYYSRWQERLSRVEWDPIRFKDLSYLYAVIQDLEDAFAH